MKKRLTHDFETQSESDLRKQGAYKYSLHPSTKPTCLAAKFHGQDAMMFLDTEEINRHWAKVPAGFRYHWNRAIEQEYEFSAHNSYFEKCIYDNILVKRYGWPPIPSKLRRCTAAKAAACALPRNLDGAGEAMRLHTQKDKAGYNAMMMSCKPTRQHNAWVKARREISEGKKVGKKKQTIAAEPEPQKFITPQSHPEVFRTLYTYCKIDVKSEEELDDSLPDLIPQEQEIWHFNQMLNWRGLRFDRPLVEKIVAIMATESEKKTTELDNLTMGLVQTGGAVKSILEFLEMEGVELPNLRKKTVEDALKEFDLADNTRQLLELRKALSMTSTKKYQSFLNRAVDDRVRDILMYHGASTGRDTGTGIMPHNFPRGLISKWAAEHAIDILENHDWDVAKEILNFYFGDSLGVVFSALLRNMIIPDDGHELYVADFSKIEVAVLWWLADNKDGLDVLRSGKDPYKFMAARNTGKKYEDIKDDSDDRQLGKAQILGCIAEGTPILTSYGLKPIEEIELKDRLWDGKNFVNHGGLLRKGLKTVIKIESEGLELTPDHRVLTINGWKTALELTASTHLLELEDPIVELKRYRKNLREELNAVSWCAAYAELKKNFESINFGPAKVYFAGNVLFKELTEAEAERDFGASWLIRNLERVGRLVSIILNVDAKIILTKTFQGMAVAELNVNSHPIEVFWNMLLRCAGLINLYSPWTELRTIDTMSPETYESSLSLLTTSIKETFDIANCGPNHCFQAGRQIVSNSGFGMGWRKFQQTAWDLYRLKLSDEQSKAAIDTYRIVNKPVKDLWGAYERAAVQVVENGPGAITYANYCRFMMSKRGFLFIALPSGRKLAYRDPQISWRETEWGPRKTLEFMGLDKSKKKLALERTWGGTLTENIVQAVARDLMMPAMVRLEKQGYKGMLSVHDEGLTMRKIGLGNVPEFVKIMTEPPPWAKGLPLEAKGWCGERYRK